MDTLALILVIIGALNWGLIGLFQFDLVASLFGGMSATFARIVYTLVALSAVWCVTLLFREPASADVHSREAFFEITAQSTALYGDFFCPYSPSPKRS